MISSLRVRYLLYGIIVVVAVLLRWCTPLTTILDNDSLGYIAPALDYMMSGTFDHVYSRSYPYPGIVLILLSAFRDINAICIFQHICALLSGIGLILLLEKMSARYGTSPKGHIVFTITATLLLYHLLLDGNTIAFEKTLRPEGLMMPSFVLVLVLLYQYATAGRVAYRLAILTGLLISSSFLSLLHPRMGAGFIAAGLIACIYESTRQARFKMAISGVLILLFTASCALVWIPEIILIKKYDPRAESFAHRQFTYSHAQAVYRAITDGYAADPRFDTSVMLPAIAKALGSTNHNEERAILGYNIDYLQYDLADGHLSDFITDSLRSSSAAGQGYAPMYSDSALALETDRAYSRYYIAWADLIAKHYPLSVCHQAARQLGFVFFDPSISFSSYPATYTFEQSFDTNQSNLFHFLRSSLRFQQPQIVSVSYPGILSSVSTWESYPVKLLILLSFISIIMVLRFRASLWLICLSVLLLFSLSTVAVIHTFDIPRYAHSLTSLSIMVIIFAWLEMWHLYDRNDQTRIPGRDKT